jgi:hypothetical protein
MVTLAVEIKMVSRGDVTSLQQAFDSACLQIVEVVCECRSIGDRVLPALSGDASRSRGWLGDYGLSSANPSIIS